MDNKADNLLSTFLLNLTGAEDVKTWGVVIKTPSS